MDLTEIRIENTFAFNLRHPKTSEILDIKLVVFGFDSKEYQAAMHKLRNRRMSEKNKNVTSEQLTNTAMELVSMSVKSWENITEDGKPIECTIENKMKVFKNHPWIYEQIDREISDRANFLADAATS